MAKVASLRKTNLWLKVKNDYDSAFLEFVKSQMSVFICKRY